MDAGRIAGVDGCRAGWLRVEQSADGEGTCARVFASAAELLADAAAFAAIGIDVPIGLPDAEPRACDRLARAMIRPRGASVFPAPVRAALAAATHADACARSRAASTRALSIQAWHIVPKIREVDVALRGDPVLQARVFEVHPEVSFRVWAGEPMAHAKRSAAGLAARRRLVEARFPGQLDLARRAVARRDASGDDIVDAFAALWTAGRIARGAAIRLPDTAPHDAAGLRMQILV